MPEDTKIIADSTNMQASNAAAIAEEARQRAHEVQTAKIVNESLTSFFASQSERERFISTQRIPFICADIRLIKDDIKESIKLQSEIREKIENKLDEGFVTKERFWPVEKGFYSLVGLIITLVVTAIVMTTLKFHL